MAGELVVEGRVAGTLYEVSYVRDALGRVVEKDETVEGERHVWSYRYDVAGRLVEVRRDGVAYARYGYDANGNRTHVDGVAVATYDERDRLLRYGDASYGWTASGELREKATPAGVVRYEYDALGNLRKVTLADGRVIEYVVDGLGRRIGKKVDGVLVKGWLYKDGLNPVAELDGSRRVVALFVYGERAYVPSVVVRIDPGSGRRKAYRVVTDHLGSVRLVVDAGTGAVVQRMDYDPWGRVIRDTNPGFQPFGFAGGLYDPDTGLVRFGARDYDAEVGRWTAVDPILFAGGDTNLYGYVLNDPVNWSDPTGELAPATVAIVGGTVVVTWAVNWVYWNVINPEPLPQPRYPRDSGSAGDILGCTAEWEPSIPGVPDPNPRWPDPRLGRGIPFPPGPVRPTRPPVFVPRR